jgi:hypothetical protein
MQLLPLGAGFSFRCRQPLRGRPALVPGVGPRGH